MDTLINSPGKMDGEQRNSAERFKLSRCAD